MNIISGIVERTFYFFYHPQLLREFLDGTIPFFNRRLIPFFHLFLFLNY